MNKFFFKGNLSETTENPIESSKSSKVLNSTNTTTTYNNHCNSNTTSNRTRLFPKTIPTTQVNISSVNKISQPHEPNSMNKPSSSLAEQQQQSQRRSQSVSDLDVDSINESSSSSSICNNEEANNKSQKSTPKFPLLTNNSSNTSSADNSQNSAHQKSACFERLSASRSSASNLLQNRDLSFNSSNQNLRSSFNTHQTLKPTNNGASNDSNTVEYASYKIKPSQYKQTGIFLPINNNTTSINNGISNTNLNIKKQSSALISKKQVNMIRLIKEDLEILIQKLRNLQKNRHWSFTSLVDTNTSVSLATNMKQFKSLVDDFNEKIGQQINLLILMSNDDNAQEIQEHHLQLRQLHSIIKQNCSILNSGNELNSDIEGCSVNNTEKQNSQDVQLSNLSKSLNDFMQHLDKLNGCYTSVTLN